MTDQKTPRPKTMKAVFWEGKPYEMVTKSDVPMPRLSEPEDAVVRITTSALCGTDLHTYHGILGSAEVPYAVGHEAVGIVEQVGDAVDSFQVGDRVVVLATTQDGVQSPHNQIFPNTASYGLGNDFGPGLGGLQAEYVRVPHADSSLLKIPKKLPDREWLFLGDIFPTAWEALSWSGFEAGDTVAVFGAGPVGLLCAYSAIIRGASLVYVVDHVPQRLAKAASIGAVPINFTKGASASEQILALQPGGVNRAVDCCGQECVNAELKPQQDYIIREAVKVTSVGGGVGIPGSYLAQEASAGAPNAGTMKPELLFPVSEACIKSVTVRFGLVELLPSLAPLFKLIENGRARPGFVVTGEYSLDDAPKAWKRFDQHLEIKTLLRGRGKEGREDFVWDAEKEGKEAETVADRRVSGRAKRMRMH
ncbi:alcohol dehydrogenase GroES-like domain-containing protein [Colletotrichum plurivorum]|uniref:Alcohol dehydrogenase GroES-like domain-containing protein n=1 Tax=Colletotrichum plurivorum TaxID=2175906 RepID=A0A8H6KUB7_9PEZI|nr:alcohol dehydrogenase GroES-like domain-containing protein [Colletotrichum plurivorum]